MSSPLPSERIHATCLVLGTTGILIRGEPGSGKTTLALRLIRDAERSGRFGRLVADDRVALSARNGRLVARAVPVTAGLVELRGSGLVRVPHEPACLVGIVVDLLDAPFERLPETSDLRVELMGIRVSRVPATLETAPNLLAWRVRGGHDTVMTDP